MPDAGSSFTQAGLPPRADVRARLKEVFARLPLPPLAWRVIRFLMVGLAGLAVDAGLFHWLYGSNVIAPVARAISLVIATLVTWSLNRTFTFDPSGHRPIHEALRYAGVALVAQGFNYLMFLILLHVTGAAHPLRMLVVTAVMTAALSFTGQSLFAFRQRQAGHVSFER